MSDSIRRHRASCHATDGCNRHAKTTRCSELHVIARGCARHSKTYSGVGPDRSRRLSVGKRTLPDERAQLWFLLTSLETCNSGNASASIEIVAADCQAMTSRYLDCSMPIEEELWWYDLRAISKGVPGEANGPEYPFLTARLLLRLECRQFFGCHNPVTNK